MKVMAERRRDSAEIQKLRDAPAPKPIEAPEHLQAIAKGPLVKLVSLMFWKLRNQFPEMAITLTEHDIRGFEESLTYNHQVPKLRADALRACVVFGVCDATTNDMIVLSENNEQDLASSEHAKKVRYAKDTANVLVNDIRSDLAQGITSNDTVNRMCESLLLLARA